MKGPFRMFACVLVTATLIAPLSFAQTSTPSVFIEPQQGFESLIAASMIREKVHLDPVADRAKATYLLRVSPLKMTTSVSASSWVVDVIETKDAIVSVELSETASNKVVWVDSMQQPTEGRRTEQAMADLVARYLKKFLEKNSRVLAGSENVQQPRGLASMFSGHFKEVFLIPEGYQGHAYILYGVPKGDALNENRQEVIYRIPQDGVLRVRESKPPITESTKYFYERQNGSLVPIPLFFRNLGPAEPEGDTSASLPHTERLKGPAGCTVQLKEFSVDTNSRLISEYQRENLGQKHDHPDFCSQLQ